VFFLAFISCGALGILSQNDGFEVEAAVATASILGSLAAELMTVLRRKRPSDQFLNNPDFGRFVPACDICISGGPIKTSTRKRQLSRTLRHSIYDYLLKSENFDSGYT
jgi:hypothetical protein